MSAHGDAHQHAAPRVGGGEECLWCPLCVLLQALAESRPEVTEHLTAASRELARALQRLLEGHVERTARPRDQLRRIRVE